MGLLNDAQIKERCERQNMISPAVFEQVKHNDNGDRIISYGLSSYGYDVRLAREFKIFSNIHSGIVDPKNFDDKVFVDFVKDRIMIPPNSFALGRSLEKMNIPRDILALCIGKSTYARCGVVVSPTPLEPEWYGHITIEISNTTNMPALVYANEGIMQLNFFKADEVCKISYGDRQGKYQDQSGITLAKT